MECGGAFVFGRRFQIRTPKNGNPRTEDASEFESGSRKQRRCRTP
jgi:hypothetical protein